MQPALRMLRAPLPCYLLPTASAATVSDMGASASGNGAASGNSATSCVRTATINTDCTARIDTAAIVAATTAILIVRITISSAIVTAATGYNGSPSNDRTATIGGSTSNCCTASNCATTIGGTASSCTASSCATSGSAAALAPD